MTTRPPLHLRRAAALLLGLVFIASACQADGDGAAATREGGDGRSAVSGEASEDDHPGPLAALMGADLDQGAMDEEFRVQRRAVEDRIIACMADEGFAYEPELLEPLPTGPRSELPPDEFAAEYGFGLTTLDATERRPGVESPNEELLAGMSASERDAWSIALHGVAPDEDGHLDRSFTAGEDGCSGAASREIFGEGGGGFDQEPWRPLIEEITGLHDQVQRDPRVVAAAEEWTACLADAGHPGYSLDGDGDPAPEEVVLERLEALPLQGGTGDGGDTPEGTTVVPGARSGAASPGRDLSRYDPDELAALQAVEIELAVAELPCRQAYDRVAAEVSLEYEQAFVDANRAELEAYRDAMAEAEGAG